MKHDPALIAEAKPWLVKAVRDLRAAELSLRASPALLDDEYAWKYRYPGEADEPALGEASEALATAGEVVGAIIAALPEPVRP